MVSANGRIVYLKWSMLFTLFLMSGCSTIMHGGGHENIGISSSPPDAQVVIDGKNMGATPMTANLSRGDQHTVEVRKTGYEPYSGTITNSVSGWVWGNILFGGLIGLAVDFGTGGVYDLSPQNLHASLSKE